MLSPFDRRNNLVHKRGPQQNQTDRTSPGRKADYTDVSECLENNERWEQDDVANSWDSVKCSVLWEREKRNWDWQVRKSKIGMTRPNNRTRGDTGNSNFKCIRLVYFDILRYWFVIPILAVAGLVCGDGPVWAETRVTPSPILIELRVKCVNGCSWKIFCFIRTDHKLMRPVLLDVSDDVTVGQL
jgi:hypothetical protein